jgi:hypothetical protein
VKRLAKFSAKQHKFEAQELGGMVTVEEYFRRSKLLFLQSFDKPSSLPSISRIQDHFTLSKSSPG